MYIKFRNLENDSLNMHGAIIKIIRERYSKVSVCTLTLHFRFLEPCIHIVLKQMRLRLVYGIIIGRNVFSYGSIIVFVSINILYRSLDLDLGQICCQGCNLLHIYSHH